ncbi:uncharacterized protein LOC142592785 isoform X3 [Dermacentor variabilis]|uniref:uncharacterized protein LOC142592785 isoform X3 n=1 Tax=Dermacentor variabilis TaxID=34621 RepID=UPI003F5BE886
MSRILEAGGKRRKSLNYYGGSEARRHHHLTTTKNQELQQKHLILNITVECINGRFKGLYLSDNYRRWWQVTTGTPLPLYSLLLRSRNTV